MKDTKPVQETKKQVKDGLIRIDRSGLPGKLRPWFLLFSHVMWPLMLYEVEVNDVEAMERKMS